MSKLNWKQQIVFVVLALLAVVPIAIAWDFYRKNIVNVPYADQWCDAVPTVLSAYEGTFEPGQLLRQHSAHRILEANFKTYLFYRFDNWNLANEAGLNFGYIILIIGGMVWLLWKQEALHPLAIVAGAVLLSLVFFNMRLRSLWMWAYASPYLALYVILMAILVLLRAFSQNWTTWISVLLLTILATVSIASSFILWVIAPLVAWVRGYRRWQYYAVWVATAGVVFWLYYRNFSVQNSAIFCESGGVATVPLDPALLIGLMLYFIQILAIPLLSNMDYDMIHTPIVGGWLFILLMVNLAYMARVWWQKKQFYSFMAWGGIMVVGLFGAAGIAVGRAVYVLYPNVMFASNYTLQPSVMLSVIVVVVLIATAHLLNLDNTRYWQRGLVMVNGVSLVLFILLYLNANAFARNVQAQPHNRIPYLYPSPDDAHCLRNYFFTEDTECWRAFLWDGILYDEDFYDYVQRLAEYRLTLFNDMAFALVGSYDPGTAIMVDMPLVAQQLVVTDEYGQRIPEHDIVRRVAPDQAERMPPDHVVHLIDDGSNPIQGPFWYFGMDKPTVPYTYLWHENYTAQRLSFFEPYQVIPVFYAPPVPSEPRTKIIYADEIVMENWEAVDGVMVDACESITFDFWWSVSAEQDIDYSMSLNLVFEDSTPIAQADTQLGPKMRTSAWRTDRIYYDQRTLTIPCDTPAGSYPVISTVYNYREPDQGLDARFEDGTPLGNWAYMTNVTIIPTE